MGSGAARLRGCPPLLASQPNPGAWRPCRNTRSQIRQIPATCPVPALLAARNSQLLPAPAHPRCVLSAPFAEGWSCYHPLRDVVVPPVSWQLLQHRRWRCPAVLPIMLQHRQRVPIAAPVVMPPLAHTVWLAPRNRLATFPAAPDAKAEAEAGAEAAGAAGPHPGAARLGPPAFRAEWRRRQHGRHRGKQNEVRGEGLGGRAAQQVLICDVQLAVGAPSTAHAGALVLPLLSPCASTPYPPPLTHTHPPTPTHPHPHPPHPHPRLLFFFGGSWAHEKVPEYR